MGYRTTVIHCDFVLVNFETRPCAVSLSDCPRLALNQVIFQPQPSCSISHHSNLVWFHFNLHLNYFHHDSIAQQAFFHLQKQQRLLQTKNCGKNWSTLREEGAVLKTTELSFVQLGGSQSSISPCFFTYPFTHPFPHPPGHPFLPPILSCGDLKSGFWRFWLLNAFLDWVLPCTVCLYLKQRPSPTVTSSIP